jgi:hypothetical protein
MLQLKDLNLTYYWITALAVGLSFFIGCAPVAGPTLNEVRSGQGRGPLPADTSLQPGEIRAEVIEIDPSRREIRVQTDDGRRQVLEYDINRTRVGYHGSGYNVDQLEPGDMIAFQPSPRDINYVDAIRLQEPVQTRPGSSVAQRLPAQRSPLPSRPNVIEGTVDRIQYDLGVFEVRPATGRTVTVSIPYNAKAADVENFRRLRRGDRVRVEGEFVNSDNLQLLAFLAPSSS